MVNRFGLDYMVHFLKEDDDGLLHRSLEAAAIFDVASQMAKDQDTVTPEGAKLLIPLKRAIEKKR